MRIAVVERSNILIDILRTTFASEPFDLYYYSGHQDALEVLKNFPTDIIIVEHEDDFNGILFLDQLREIGIISKVYLWSENIEKANLTKYKFMNFKFYKKSIESISLINDIKITLKQGELKKPKDTNQIEIYKLKKSLHSIASPINGF